MARTPQTLSQLDAQWSLFPDPDRRDIPSTTDRVRRERALRVHELLCAHHQCPIAYFHNLDPLSELVSSTLSHRTRNRESGIAYKALRTALPTWQDVIDAPTPRVQELIGNVTWPEVKAPRIQFILKKVKELRGELSLEFLRDLSPAQALRWLRQLPGVGPKTAAAVLSFSALRMKALPVDSHHYRVAHRLGLIPPGVTLEQAHQILEGQLPESFNAQDVYDNHEALMIHGQKCCFHRNPACDRCVVASLCPSCRVSIQPT